MNKPRALQISIPTPCKQGWDNMTKASTTGRHCDSCNKTVIDFTNFTDKELGDFFLKNKGNVCGNFSKYQVNRAIAIREDSKYSFFYKIFFSTALASWLGFASTGFAQNVPTNKQKPATQLTTKRNHSHSSNTITPIQSKLPETTLSLIEAKLPEPMPNTSCKVTNTEVCIVGGATAGIYVQDSWDVSWPALELNSVGIKK